MFGKINTCIVPVSKVYQLIFNLKCHVLNLDCFCYYLMDGNRRFVKSFILISGNLRISQEVSDRGDSRDTLCLSDGYEHATQHLSYNPVLPDTKHFPHKR